jgi:hypothetical protein
MFLIKIDTMPHNEKAKTCLEMFAYVLKDNKKDNKKDKII